MALTTTNNPQFVNGGIAVTWRHVSTKSDMVYRVPTFFICVLFLLALIAPSYAQAAGEMMAVIPQNTAVLAGPGDTYAQVGWMLSGAEVTITERNAVGNWLRIIQPDATGGNVADDGWVQIGDLTYNPTLQLGDVPVNETLPDADLSQITDTELAALYAAPVIPAISPALVEVFRRGQALGNHANVVSKVGDSNSVSPLYLAPLGRGEYDLGPYAFLQDTVDYFGASFTIESASAHVGMNAFSVFDPFWANSNECLDGESPLMCELRVSQPSVALIMFGANDTFALNSTDYEGQMRLIVETSLERGVIPVLIAFSASREHERYFQVVRFNTLAMNVAQAYDVPFVNFWSAARSLYNGGIGDDQVHLTASGGTLRLGGYESHYGLPLHNLIVVHTLAAIRATVMPDDAVTFISNW